MVQGTPGAQFVSTLTGAEGVEINLGATSAVTTVAAIAATSGSFETDTPTSVTTNVGTTLTAAQLSTGVLNRSGPTANFTDTTDTAVAIAAANQPGYSFYIDIKNLTQYQMTIQGGSGVTFSSSSIIPGNSVAEFLVTVNAAGTAVVFNHVFSTLLTSMNPELNNALNTVGAGTITGAQIATGVVTRGGTQVANFTDTTDTGPNIIAAQPNVHLGSAWEFTYYNGTAYAATIAANATGVTITNGQVIPAGGWARYLVTYSSAANITMALIADDADPPSAQFQTASLSAGTLAAGAITGAAFVVYRNTGATPGNQTVRTAAQMLADFPGAYVGYSYMLRIINTGAGTLTLVADAGPTVTINGTATVAQNVFRDYVVTFNTATTATIQSVGSGVSP
jgi:hypothetical protein